MARRILAWACILSGLCRVWSQNGAFSGVWHYVDVHSIMCPGGKGLLAGWEQLYGIACL